MVALGAGSPRPCRWTPSSGHAPGQKVPEQRVEVVHRPGARLNEVVAPLGEHPQHVDQVLLVHSAKALALVGGDGGVDASSKSFSCAHCARREHPDPRRELRRDVDDHALAVGDQVLSERPPETRGSFYGPSTLLEALRPPPERPQSLCLSEEKLACSNNSPDSSIAATEWVALWGSTPMSTSTSFAPPSSPVTTLKRAEDIPTLS